MIDSEKSRNEFLRSPGGKAACFAAGSLLIAGVGAFIYATRVEPRRFGIESVDIPTGRASSAVGNGGNGTAPGARQFRILHLSDIHLHGEDYLKADFLRQITDDDYDIVVLTGDIFETYSGIKFASSLLARKPRIGAFAVLGNHDHYDYGMFNKTFGRIWRKFRHGVRRDVTPMVSALKDAGYTVLRNENCVVEEHNLFVVGIDWPTIPEEQLQELTADAKDSQFKLCLFHLPKNLEAIARSGMHLAVGGHTHGGQVRVPGFGALITDSELPRREASGLIWRGKTAFHVSRGLGADPRSNIRFFCPPAGTILNVSHQP